MSSTRIDLGSSLSLGLLHLSSGSIGSRGCCVHEYDSQIANASGWSGSSHSFCECCGDNTAGVTTGDPVVKPLSPDGKAGKFSLFVSHGLTTGRGAGTIGEGFGCMVALTFFSGGYEFLLTLLLAAGSFHLSSPDLIMGL